MPKNVRNLLLASTALGLLMISPAHAADSTADAIKALQAQVNALQQQLSNLQVQQKAQAETTAAAAPKPATTTADGVQKEILPGVKVTLGGFIAMDGVYRSKNEVQDATSTYNSNSIPFGNVANAHQSEFHGTARQTRLSLLTEGNVDKDMKLTGYIESDFQGAGASSSPIQTTNFVPRLRQAFATVDRNDWGLHVTAGQAWSLVTLYQNGLTPRKESIPNLSDGGYLPGFNFTRSPQVRVVKDLLDNKISVGVSVENPQVNFGQVTAPSGVTASATPGSGFGATNSAISTDVAPDVVGKVAFDPGWGHYEVFGIARFFHDQVGTTNFHNNVVMAGGGGAGVLLPVLPKMVDVRATIMAGEGIGRYSVALLPDFAFAPNGAIKPLTEGTALLGIITHPTPTLEAYFYAGGEKVMRENTASTSYGYGDFALNNSACNTAGGSCSAQTSSIWTLTPGVWKEAYKGDYGTMKVGAQYSFTRRNAFDDANGNNPHSLENIAFLSFRYSPF